MENKKHSKKKLATKLQQILLVKNWQIAVAESCTGGLIASTITSISGSSEIFGYGVVSYSNDAKTKILKVSTESLKKYGAVSETVAKEMALGIQKLSNSNVAISVTGIAGPTSAGTKPIGLVFVGFAINNEIDSKKIQLQGSRIEIQNQTTLFALTEVIKKLEFI